MSSLVKIFLAPETKQNFQSGLLKFVAKHAKANQGYMSRGKCISDEAVFCVSVCGGGGKVDTTKGATTMMTQRIPLRSSSKTRQRKKAWPNQQATRIYLWCDRRNIHTGIENRQWCTFPPHGRIRHEVDRPLYHPILTWDQGDHLGQLANSTTENRKHRLSQTRLSSHFLGVPNCIVVQNAVFWIRVVILWLKFLRTI